MIDNNKSVGRWIWLLAFLAVFGVFCIFCGFFYFWIGHFPKDKEGIAIAGLYGDSFGVLNSLFSGLGFSVLIVTLLYQQKQIRLQSIKDNYDAEERRSLFNLKAYEEANIEAMNLLDDNNNDRATWIRAARLLGHAVALAKNVTVENHLRVLEYKSLEYRTFFRKLLEGKSGAFFYGVNYEGISLDGAAAASTIPTEVNGRVTHGSSMLSEHAIFAVVTAAEWPDNYIEPLEEGFSDNNIESKTFFYDGLRSFLHHAREWASFDGEIKRRDRNDLN